MLEYKSRNEGYRIFAGDDKHENELLIKYGWPEDVWFHVDDFSSPHVYTRPLLPLISGAGSVIDQLPQDVIEDCCQIVKGGSIEGNKQDKVRIVYTPWSNLHKDHHSMDVGTIGFKNTKLVKRVPGVTKNPQLLKQLEKSKEQRRCDFEKERLQRDREDERKEKAFRKEAAVEREKAEKAEREAYDLKHYANLKPSAKSQEKMREEDFM